jgi:membrane-bound metal-dependent hydrolase YbcI (DUF457 family)
MPFPICHGIIGASLFRTVQREVSVSKNGRLMLLCGALAIIPDLDFIFEWVFQLRGWHRGFTHSIAFGAALGFLAAVLTSVKNFRDTSGILLASVSHAPLDALVTTSKGTGVELLWPLTSYRFHFGVFDYFSFSLDPRFDPWSDILTQLLKVSLIELIVCGPILLLVLTVKPKA